MASKKNTAIDMFAKLLFSPLPDAIKDVSSNNHYKPKDNIVDTWSVTVKKDENMFLYLGLSTK